LQLEKNSLIKNFYEEYIHNKDGKNNPGFVTKLSNDDKDKYEGQMKDVIPIIFF